jgi:hypothetical protein
VPLALLYIVLGIIAFYLVAGLLRWLRQELQHLWRSSGHKDE